METLTPFEKVLYEALKNAPDGLTFEQLQSLTVPPRPQAKVPVNRIAVHMKNLRQKLGIKIDPIRGVGYKISDGETGA